jgi:purine-binding chemotaxis protein CheW
MLAPLQGAKKLLAPFRWSPLTLRPPATFWQPFRLQSVTTTSAPGSDLRLPALEWRPRFCHSIHMNEANRNSETYFNDVIAEGSVRRLQIVRAGSRYFGITTENISTIVVWREPTPLPDAPQSVLGVVSIQGRMLTVLDLAKLTSGKADGDDAARGAAKHIVALHGDEQLAIAVDEVSEVIELSSAESKTQTQTSLVPETFHHENREIKILSLKELFPAAIQGRERRRRRF